MKGKKGTDKPIEIFIALFIILAVALVILKMFSGQISAKTKELGEIERENKLREAMTNAQRYCDEKCSLALTNSCDLKSLATFCITKIEGGLDLNGNGQNNDYDDKLAGGVGVCEDGLYCPLVASCSCNQVLNTKNCIKIVCKYWTEEVGMSAVDANNTIVEKLTPGTCEPTGSGTLWTDFQEPRCT
jgi:hypothetical protein